MKNKLENVFKNAKITYENQLSCSEDLDGFRLEDMPSLKSIEWKSNK